MKFKNLWVLICLATCRNRGSAVIDEHLAAGCPNCNDELDELLAGLSGVAAILDGPPLKPEHCIPVQRAIEQRILSPSAGNRRPKRMQDCASWESRYTQRLLRRESCLPLA